MKQQNDRKTLQKSSDAELLELHCNHCGQMLGFVTLFINNDELYECRVKCWTCRTKEMDEEKRVLKLATD